MFRDDVAARPANGSLVAQLPMCPTSAADSHRSMPGADSVGCTSVGTGQDFTRTGSRYHAL